MIGVHAFKFTKQMGSGDDLWFTAGEVVLAVDNSTLPIHGDYNARGLVLAPRAVLPGTDAVFLDAAPLQKNGYLQAFDLPFHEMREHVSYSIILRAVFGYADNDSLTTVLARHQALVCALKFHINAGSEPEVEDLPAHLKVCEDAIVAAAACETRFGILGSGEKHALTVLAHTRVTQGPRLAEALRDIDEKFEV